jgi:UDP-N-acetylglucosamine 2-epimerase (non-hydrolysing)
MVCLISILLTIKAQTGINMPNPIIIVIGTRPEAIKMLPIYFQCKEAGIPVLLCSTQQHDELINEVLRIFDVKPDFNFSIMKHNQDLFYITNQVLAKMKIVLDQIRPALVLVQGDTTTTMAAALASFYKQIPVGHVEAGLRTYDSKNPFPEETNRRIISTFSTFNFVPTTEARNNLLAERVPESSICITGNTVVDALHTIQKKLAERKNIIPSVWLETMIATEKTINKKIIAVTAHRRESFNGGIERILSAIKKYALQNPNVFIIYPYHPNPYVLNAIQTVQLINIKNIVCCKALSYTDMMYLLGKADCIVTDSGGICEEGVTLSKPVLIAREKTERMEAVTAGSAMLVGTDEHIIFDGLQTALYQQNKFTFNPYLYGTGDAAQKIVTFIADIVYLNPYSQNNSLSYQKETV